MQKPTSEQLAQAHAESGLRGTLTDAMRSPVLARCLEITALALAHTRADRYRPLPAAPPSTLAIKAQSHRFNTPRPDFKRACAADKDEPQ
ncbi:hypothetical protein LP085_17010 [Achromobacter sp. MY14]|uniref:hypothetical protein n=1 Tax=unclassified Achromobacter TaxID=2626865 RepID=UPI001E558882|nr:hypothetical protein [Achromobacter sp. MY14]MCD0498560.1 hypothetical protein [Achromobacter sp. MY14]